MSTTYGPFSGVEGIRGAAVHGCASVHSRVYVYNNSGVQTIRWSRVVDLIVQSCRSFGCIRECTEVCRWCVRVCMCRAKSRKRNHGDTRFDSRKRRAAARPHSISIATSCSARSNAVLDTHDGGSMMRISRPLLFALTHSRNASTPHRRVQSTPHLRINNRGRV